MHGEYKDYDLQNPDSTSLQIRMLFSTCFQLHTGESRLAWHSVAEAGFIARSMRLYCEHAICQFDPLESILLRFSLWSLYIADCAAVCVANRALTLHELLFDIDMDLEPFGSTRVPLIVEDGMKTSLLEGFHKIQHTWSLASKVILLIRAYTRCHWNADEPLIQQAELAKISQRYSEFIAYLDEIPPSLQSPATSFYHDGASSRYDVSSAYTSQRYRLLSAFSFLKLLIVYNCVCHGLASVIGLRDEESTMTVEVINAAREYI